MSNNELGAVMINGETYIKKDSVEYMMKELVKMMSNEELVNTTLLNIETLLIKIDNAVKEEKQ